MCILHFKIAQVYDFGSREGRASKWGASVAINFGVRGSFLGIVCVGIVGMVAELG